MNSYSVPLTQVVEDFRLQIWHASTDYEGVDIVVEEVTRPGIQFAGFFEHFERLRLQVVGNVEFAYLSTLSHERSLEIFDQLFSRKIPAMIFARNLEPTPECLEMAKKHDITILRCLESTSYLVSGITAYLKNALAPRISRHGVLVEVYGEGILILGESGVGKELFAQSIHNYSERRNKPFVAINCASISPELIDSELFGYESGAFTGASKNGHVGKFELANGGTLFLDEVAELPAHAQTKLLRALETKTITRVGGTKNIAVDVRVVAATNRSLEKMIEDGLVEEAKKLMSLGIEKNPSAAMAIGYRETIEAIRQNDFSNLAEKIFLSTKKLIKKQRKFLKTQIRF